MIKKIVKIRKLDDNSSRVTRDDLAYWLNKSPEERISTVEYLRRQYHGNAVRLQRTVKIIKQKQS